MSTTLDAVRKAVRADGTSVYDDELTGLIAACEADLRISGVKDPHTCPELYEQACKFYAKANFGLAGEDAERWQKCYEMLRAAYAMADFGEGGVYG